MPGVLLVEAMAQIGGLAMLAAEDMKGKVPYFTGIDSVRFRKPVVPGDQVRIVAEIVKSRRTIAKCEAKAYVETELVVEAELMFALVDM
jgi:3-hydroxyacyl-[acyl-carrier-protein] dehydratase